MRVLLQSEDALGNSMLLLNLLLLSFLQKGSPSAALPSVDASALPVVPFQSNPKVWESIVSRPQAPRGFGNSLSRRHLLLCSALLAAACNRTEAFGNEQDPLSLRLVYWGYEPQLLAWNLDRFSTQYPGLRVTPEAFSSDYFQTVSLLLNEGQPIDTVYVRGDRSCGVGGGRLARTA